MRGTSLIEVLIALLVLAIGVLGTIALETTGIQYAGGSLVREQAVALMDSMAERIRANPLGVTAGGYDSISAPPLSPPSCEGAVCTPAQMAAYDAAQWETAIADELPNAHGAVQSLPGTPRRFLITVYWSEAGGAPKPNAACPSDPSKYCLRTFVRT